MNRFRLAVMLACAIGLPSRAGAEDKKPDPQQPKGIDGATAAAWEKRGFTVGWMRERDGTVWRRPNEPKAHDDAVPAVWYSVPQRPLTDETLKDLPPVEVPFVLLAAPSELTDAGLKHLARFNNLVSLSVGGAKVTGEGLKHLAGLDKLVTLSLSRTEGTNANLKHLAGFKSLTKLYLGSTWVTDQGLKELAALKNLTALALTSNPITDDGLVHLAGMKNLTALYLTSTRVTDAGLEHLVGLENLTTLHLQNTDVTDKNLKALARLKKLNDLTLDHKSVTDEALRTLSELGLLHALHDAEVRGGLQSAPDHRRPTKPEDVRSVHLNNTRVTGEGVKYLAALPNLTNLDLGPSQATPEGVKHAAKLPKLLVVYVGSREPTGEMLKPLAGHKTLARVIMPLNDEALRALYEAGLLHLLGEAKGADGKRPAGHDEIVSLDLSESRLRGEGLKYVGRLKNLTTLDLGRSRVSSIWLEDFQRTLPKCVVITK